LPDVPLARHLLTATAARDLAITTRGIKEAFLALTGDADATPSGAAQ
jgi:ABC-2 type transport system ATP-binding protein